VAQQRPLRLSLSLSLLRELSAAWLARLQPGANQAAVRMSLPTFECLRSASVLSKDGLPASYSITNVPSLVESSLSVASAGFDGLVRLLQFEEGVSPSNTPQDGASTSQPSYVVIRSNSRAYSPFYTRVGPNAHSLFSPIQLGWNWILLPSTLMEHNQIVFHLKAISL